MRTIKNFFKSLISGDVNSLSSMRFSMLYIVILIGIGMFFIDISIIYAVIKNKMDGYEVATIIGANSTLLFSMVYGKYQQAKVENNNTNVNKDI
jgi:hypothetical protein